MKKVKKLLVACLMTVMVFSTTSVAFAKDKKQDDLVARRAFLDQNIAELGGQGPEKVDEWLQANGVAKVKDMVVSADSAPGSVSLYNIDGYNDMIAKKYIIKGYWTWLTTPDAISGALDGVSLAMAKTTDWSPVSGYVFDSNPANIAVYDKAGKNYPYAGGTSKIDRSGILYTFQDSWVGTSYCGYLGQVWAWMTTPPTQLPIYIKMDFEHTWSAANLSTFGFSWQYPNAPNINMTWNITPSNFTKANQITLNSWRGVN